VKTPTSVYDFICIYFLDGRGVRKTSTGQYNAVYKHPRALYTKSTPTFIYFVVRGKLEEKETKT
jgi:hypothetical protein